MKSFFFALILLVQVRSYSMAQYTLTPIHVSGSPETTYTLAILAEGYTSAQLDEFKIDAQKATNLIFTNPTFASLKERINIYAISTPSQESGVSLIADNPSPTDPIQVTQKKETLFRVYYRNSYRAYIIDDSTVIKARMIAHEQLPFSDNVLLLVNDNSVFSGKAVIDYGVAVAAKPVGNFEYVIVHELGHSIGGLADTYSEYREESFNKTTNADTMTIRWKELLREPEVGVEKIANGVYCPNLSCIMKTTQNYFCPVCSHRLRQVVQGKSNRLATPHRILTKARGANSFLLSWDKIVGATHYELIFNDNSSVGVIPQRIVNAPDTVTQFDNLSLDPGFGRWIVQIRAYNETQSTYFASRNRVPSRDFYPELPLPRPVPGVSISQISSTSVVINCTKDAFAKYFYLRLYNDQNVVSEIVSTQNVISLKGLLPNKKYKFSVAAIVEDGEQAEYLSSSFSSPKEFSMALCNSEVVVPVTLKRKKR